MAQHSREQLAELIAASRMEVRSAAAENLADLPVQELAARIDHTLLKPESTQSQIARLCDEAIEYGFASVCVNPTWVSDAVERLSGTNVKVCTVIGFPLGASLAQTKAAEAELVIDLGASEVDMVINIGALKSGLSEVVYLDIQGVVEAAHQRGALVKTILETVLLTEDEKVAACALAKAAGADFVKTSTGFAGGGATVRDVRLMRRVVGPELGVKAAGGIRSAESALAMIAAGATRIGASAGVEIIRSLTHGEVEATVKTSGDDY